jgi:hypothetical protein
VEPAGELIGAATLQRVVGLLERRFGLDALWTFGSAAAGLAPTAALAVGVLCYVVTWLAEMVKERATLAAQADGPGDGASG